MSKIPTGRFLVTGLVILIWSLFSFWLDELMLLLINILFIDIFLLRIVSPKIFRIRCLPYWLSIPWQWIKAIIIALLLTSFVKVLFIEAYKIPSPSMEKTLLPGDYLFVSKFHYGPRIPFTPLSLPFFPSMLPGGKVTYICSPDRKYRRLKGISKIQRNDIIVFNFPQGDTVIVQYPGINYYSFLRHSGNIHPKSIDLVTHPVDKRDNYIKRCIGLPGDTIALINASVLINGVLQDESDFILLKYFVRTTGERLNDSILISMDVDPGETDFDPNSNIHILPLDKRAYNLLLTNKNVRTIRKFTEPLLVYRNIEIFPGNTNITWTPDDFGPVIIPAKNSVIKLDINNLPFYERIIRVYEKNKLEIRDENIYINGKLADSYTFKMDYYFVMGDNRHNSADSRYWGFVPEDHLIGKAVFLWYSKEQGKGFITGTRWNRLFKPIK